MYLSVLEKCLAKQQLSRTKPDGAQLCNIIDAIKDMATCFILVGETNGVK